MRSQYPEMDSCKGIRGGFPVEKDCFRENNLEHRRCLSIRLSLKTGIGRGGLGRKETRPCRSASKDKG
jgi:hypothetical protein